MSNDMVLLTSATCEGLYKALGQDFNKVETPERMAWIVLMLEYVEDKEKFFPKGKWATIQAIKDQIDRAVKYYIPKGICQSCKHATDCQIKKDRDVAAKTEEVIISCCACVHYERNNSHAGAKITISNL